MCSGRKLRSAGQEPRLPERLQHQIFSPNTSANKQSQALERFALSATPAQTWQASVFTENASERGLYTTASASSLGAWGETRVSHTVQQPNHGEEHQRTQIQHGGALAFADGKFAIGAPVRDGFAIVYPHHTITNSEVIVGDGENPRATGSTWWPALISDLPAYGHVQYPLDATDIPVGYSLGDGQMSVRSPYRAGHSLALGADMSLTAFGTALQSGVATSAKYPNQRVTLFTNSKGRFAAEGLAPGTWNIALGADGPAYTFVVPETATGLFDAETLIPDGIPDLQPLEDWL